MFGSLSLCPLALAASLLCAQADSTGPAAADADELSREEGRHPTMTTDVAGAEDLSRDEGRHPKVVTDVAVLGGATALFSIVNPMVRKKLFSDASLSRVGGHFSRPVKSALEGARENDDPFLTDFVSHPVTWGSIGYYLRRRGYSDGTALLLSQTHSLFWEYILEGTYQKPSGIDLLTNFVSASIGVLIGRMHAGGDVDELPMDVEVSLGAGGLSIPSSAPTADGSPRFGAPGPGLRIAFEIGG